GQSVDHRRVGCCRELVFEWWILCIGIGSEVVIERDILLENYHQVLNRCGGCRGMSDGCVCGCRFGGRRECGSNARSAGYGRHQQRCHCPPESGERLCL